MRLIFELHDKIDPPASCQNQNFMWILHAIWTSDSEFAQFLKSNYNLETHASTIDLTTETSTGQETMTWRWKTNSSSESTLLSKAIAPVGDARSVLSVRYGWDNGRGISLIDYDEVGLIPDSQGQIAQGTLASPTLHATAGTEAFVGKANFVVQATGIGEIHEYGDYKCETLRS